MTIKTKDVERLMKQCQIGVGGKDALNKAHNIMADCYGTLGALARERDQLQAELAKYRDAPVVAWKIAFKAANTPDGFLTIHYHGTNAITDYRQIDPNATVEQLIVKPGEMG